MDNDSNKNINKGITIIKDTLDICPKTPGIYQFKCLDEIVYIGKAKNLYKRLKSYLNFFSLSRRIQKMISSTSSINLIKTHTESDALLLESNLIKKYKPIYNIRLIDDKSFPYILISKSEKWPRLYSFRGSIKKKGFYFGPFSSPSAVKQVISIIEKGFMLRTCTDSFFESRKRPCILYQIKRCSAPCVNLIEKKDYDELTFQAISFLNGKDNLIRKKLILSMEKLSENQKYEEAGLFRDRIKALSKINQYKMSVTGITENFDIVCFFQKSGIIFIQIFFFRKGSNLGNKEYSFKETLTKDFNETINFFLLNFYLKHEVPSQILVNIEMKHINISKDAIKNKTKKKVEFIFPLKGKKKILLEMVEKNLQQSIKKYFQNLVSNTEVLNNLKSMLELKSTPNRIEIYDNSHLSGDQPVGAMVVFQDNSFQRDKYRKFNIKGTLKTSDDYFMMKQVLERRFSFNHESKWKNLLPDLIIIDGGLGHLNLIKKTLNNIGIKKIDVIAIAKGKKRNAGEETIFFKEKKIKLKTADKTSFFLQNLRDEAHRFAISSQKYRRIKKIKYSVFDDILGIGSKVRKLLINHFGSLENVKNAGIQDLKKVSGIGKVMAERIYNEFH